jgi:signal transduction histidine kinase
VSSTSTTSEPAAPADLPGEHVRRLLDAVVAVASDLRLPDVLQRIVESAARLAGARYGALGVLDEEGRELAEFVVTGLDADAERRIGRHPTGKGVLGLLIAVPEPVRLSDIRLHPQSYGFPPNHPPMHSFLGVPVRVGGAVFGNLYLAEKVDGPQFDSRDEQVVVALAATAGVAVEKARLYSDSMRRERWLEAASAITPALLAERGPDEVLERVAQQVAAVCGAGLVAVALPDDREGWVVDAAAGPEATRAVGCRLDTAHPAVVDALKRPAALRFDDPDLLPGMVPGLATGDREAHGLLLAPMALGSDPLGLLLVARGRAFPEVDRRSVAVFAGHAALALEVARAHDDQRRLALYEERDRIARDLHDSVIQRLFGTGLSMQGLREITAQPAVAQRLGEFVDDLDGTIRDIRRTIFDLREVPEPGPASLRAQLLRAVQDAARALHVEPRVAFTGPIDSCVPDEVRPDVLATLREALSNAARHAGADEVHVEVTATGAGADGVCHLELTVRDDGLGLGPAPRRGGGLATMGERAARWGGHCVVGSGPNGGTEVRWSVPLRPAPDGAAGAEGAAP